jgi:hypothetical protein
MLFRRVSRLILPLLAACGTVEAQESVLWSSDANAVNQTSAGSPMDGGFKFEIGVFKGSFVPTSGNTASWAANWAPAARTPYLTATKRFADTVVANSNATPFTVGKTAYIWGFRGSPASGEWILFRASSWTWPDANGFMYHEWFAKDATPVLGQIHSSGSPFLMKSAAVSNAAPPSTSWDQWRLDNLAGVPLDAPDQDPDHDGSPNLLEFVFGSNPVLPEAPAVTPVSLVSGHLTISIPRRIDHTATLVVEVSPDLTNWQSGAAHTQTMTETASLLVVRDLTTLDNSHPKRFIRLCASLP